MKVLEIHIQAEASVDDEHWEEWKDELMSAIHAAMYNADVYTIQVEDLEAYK